MELESKTQHGLEHMLEQLLLNNSTHSLSANNNKVLFGAQRQHGPDRLHGPVGKAPAQHPS